VVDRDNRRRKVGSGESRGVELHDVGTGRGGKVGQRPGCAPERLGIVRDPIERQACLYQPESRDARRLAPLSLVRPRAHHCEHGLDLMLDEG
jgi:hypothetical protein